MWLMPVVNRMSPRTHPCRHCVTDLQVLYTWASTLVWTHLIGCPLIIVLYQTCDFLGNTAKCFAGQSKCLPWLSSCHFIIEENQFGQAWFVLGISTLIVAIHLLLFHMPKMCSQGTPYCIILSRTQVGLTGPNLLNFGSLLKMDQKEVKG